VTVDTTFKCHVCRIGCGSQGRLSSHLQFGHGIIDTPDVPYKAVTPKFEPTLGEIVDRLAVDRIARGDWRHYVPEKTVEMDGGAVLSVDPATGAAKGVKLARFDLVPMDALIELAEHYGKGEAKYPSDADGTPNWSKGYAWSKSTQAAMRHLSQFIGGEDVDAETSTKHVIAVAWHMFALAHYMNTATGTDDRWQHGNSD